MKIDQYEEKLKYLYEAQEYLNQNKFPKYLMNKETEEEFENDIQYYLNALYKTGKKLGFDKKHIGHMIIDNVMLR